MPDDQSVTYWVQQLPQGKRDDVQKLWERYFHRLVGLARNKLKNLPRAIADEEDVALSAFDSVIRAVEKKRFPKLDDRDDLWQILVLVTKRKAANLYKHEARAKRDFRRTKEIAPANGDSSITGAQFKELISGDPDPAFAASIADECRRLLDKIPKAEWRSVALAKMDGYTNSEIAEQQKCSVASVERWLRWIREIWSE